MLANIWVKEVGKSIRKIIKSIKNSEKIKELSLRITNKKSCLIHNKEEKFKI